ncbi:MAG: GDSL-type esterase/lipase family protein [Anaerolineae bacterium]
MTTQLPPETTFLIDFNLHWVPAALGLNVPLAAAAAMFNISEAEFLAYTVGVEAEINGIARNLLAQPELAGMIDRWPLPPGGKVLALGDSITTYRYGYARLLQAMVAQRRPADQLQFINVAQSGYTSTHILENTFSQFLAHQPDWVFIKCGVNDCKRFGGPGAKMLVSLAEYRANLSAIVEAFLNHTPARPVLLTPTPVVANIVNANPDFAAMRMTWRNADLHACAEVVADLAQRHHLPLVDLFTTFSATPDPTLYLPDGLHPGPAGQRLILEQLLYSL